MNLLEGLLGGGRAAEHNDFINRYQTGNPAEGYSDQEALQRFGEAVPHLSPQQFESAAQQSFAGMSPEQRDQFGQFLQQQATQHGVNLSGLLGSLGTTPSQMAQDPGILAGVTSQLHQQGLLGQLLGGAVSGAMGGLSHGGAQGALSGAMSGAEGAALGGLAGGNPQSLGNMAGNMVGGLGGIFANPGVKAAIAGIAAMGIQQLMQQHGQQH